MPPSRRTRQARGATPQPEGRKVCLGAALFGFPAAHGDEDEYLQSLDAWVQLFLTAHADAGVLKGVATSCKAGRDLVLQSAPKARLEVTCSQQQANEAWGKRLACIQQALSVRRSTHGATTLAVICDRDYDRDYSDSKGKKREDQGPACLALIPERLAGAGESITELQVWSTHQISTTAFLTSAAPHFPNLRTLDLQIFPAALPSPTALPKLTQLSIDFYCGPYDGAAMICESISALITQLTSLEFSACDHWPDPWPVILSPETTTTTLTKLSTRYPLDDTLLGLLLSHTPSLTHLGVSEVILSWEGTYTGREWGLQQLCVEYRDGLVGSLEQLPKSTHKSGVTVKCDWETEIEMMVDHTGVDFAPWSRLSEWVFDVDMLTVMPEYSLTQADQTDALTHVLQCLRDLRTAPSTVVEFREWVWDEGMARVMCEGLREVTHLRVGVFVDSVTDEWMGHALMMGPHINRVYTESLDLLTQDYSDKVWPWDELTVRTAYLHQLLRLPSPAGRAAAPLIRTEEICLIPRESEGADGVVTDEAFIARLRAWLPHVTFTSLDERTRDERESEDPPVLTVRVDTSETDLDLATQLSLLQCVRLDQDAQRTVQLELVGWRMNTKTLPALEGLPKWSGCIQFKSCEWPLQASKYAKVASSIPISYVLWEFKQGASLGVVRSMCAGANEARAALVGALPLLVYSDSNTASKDERIGEHVILTPSVHNTLKGMGLKS